MKILSSPTLGRDGVTFYRIKQICEFLGKIEGNDYKIFLPSETDTNAEILLNNADVFITGRENLAFFGRYKNNYDCSKRLMVVDIDDCLWDINPLSNMYQFYGTEEIDMTIDGKKETLWKDGYNLNIANNREGLENLRYILEKADIVTTTTEILKQSIYEFCGNKNIVIVPNAVNFEDWQEWNFKEHKETRIGWTGGATHFIDWKSIAESLPKITKDNVKWILQGCMWAKTVEGLDYEFHNWKDVECYPYKIASLDIDIAVIPLADNRFNRNKSNIKWVEFSSLGIPCVMPDIPPYNVEAIHGKTALLYKTPEDFIEFTNLLIKDKVLRRKIGRQAREYMLKHKDIRNVAEVYNQELIKQLNKKRNVF